MVDEDAVKEAFLKIKQDILELRQEIYDLKNSLLRYPTDIQQISQNDNEVQHIIDRDRAYLQCSIGNDGVPTDRQTDRQTTDRQAFEPSETNYYMQKTIRFTDDKLGKAIKNGNIIALVTGLKEEMRQNFLKLTKQEFFIFSVVYSLDDQGIQVTYPVIAERTRLSESSIRDYVSRLIEKGIPLEKSKINNKQVIIKIKEELKNLATLDSLVKLKEFSSDRAY